MTSLLVFLLAYGGVGGTDVKQIDKQVRGLVEAQTEVQDVKLTKAQRKSLIKHDSDAEDFVRELEVQGLIAGDVERKKKSSILRVVVYSGDGALLDLLEIPIGKKKTKKLSKDTLESLNDTIVNDVATLTAPPPEPEPEPVVADADEENPNETEVAEVVAVAPSRSKKRGPKLKISVGAGMASRTFDPGPADVRGYRSSVVPSAIVALEVKPVKYVAIGGHFDRTLTMNTTLNDEQVPSSILGWYAGAVAGIPLGPVEVGAVAGIGGREFVIASDAPAPTPDGLYTYAAIGGRLTIGLGAKAALRVQGTYQPVVAGDPDMAETPTARAGFDVGGALEIGVASHVFLVGEGGIQRFTWTWDDGSSVDTYPRGTLSLGARY